MEESLTKSEGFKYSLETNSCPVEDTRETVAVHFRMAIRRRRDETHLVDRLFFHPVGTIVNSVARLLAGMHHGRRNAYVGCVPVFLILILVLYRTG